MESRRSALDRAVNEAITAALHDICDCFATDRSTIRAYPPRQKAASISIEQAQEKLLEARAH